jgi:integrase
LVDRVDCQLIVALAFVLGLRPGEIAGLQWGDVDATSLHIRRATARGVVGECKTASSVATLPLINPVLIPLRLWHEKSGKPSEGWIFPGETGDLPLSLESLTARAIVPILKKKKIEWKGPIRWPPWRRNNIDQVDRRRIGRATDTASQESRRHDCVLRQATP